MSLTHEDANMKPGWAVISEKAEMGWMPLSPRTASQCAKLAVLRHRLRGTASMKKVTIIGVDLAKNVFQLHAQRRTGRA